MFILVVNAILFIETQSLKMTSEMVESAWASIGYQLDPDLSKNLHKGEEKRDRFRLFLRALAKIEMQRVMSWISTQVKNSISYNNNQYTMCLPKMEIMEYKKQIRLILHKEFFNSMLSICYSPIVSAILQNAISPCGRESI